MPAVTLKTIGLQSQVLESLNVTGAFTAFTYVGNANPNTPHQPFTIYQFVFSNIDATVSKSASAPASSATASFWYKPVDLCGSGGGGPTDCLAWGFNLKGDAFESVTFQIERVGKIETTVASGVPIDTTTDGATLIPPSSPPVPPGGFPTGPGVFTQWFDLDTGTNPASPNNALSLPTGDDDSYLALYLSQMNPPPPPNCPELIANMNAADAYLAYVQKYGPESALPEAENRANAAREAAAPCLK